VLNQKLDFVDSGSIVGCCWPGVAGANGLSL